MKNLFKIINKSFSFFKRIKFETTKTSMTQEDKDTNLAIIAHDLKNPIIACQKALHLMINNKFGSLNTRQLEILRMCSNSLTYSKYLVENILYSYKCDNNYCGLSIFDFDVIALIYECIKELDFFIKERNYSIVINLPDVKMIYADRNELKRVILNLLFNAISYSYTNSEIEIIAYYDEKYFYFSIKNSAKYIDPKELKNIFNKNVSLNQNGKSGTGLGLYLAQKIILAHQGEMIAKSYSNNLNIFGFKLPCVKDLSLIVKK